MLKYVLLLSLLLFPSELAPDYSRMCYSKFPCTIMETRSFAYVMYEPGGEIIKRQKS